MVSKVGLKSLFLGANFAISSDVFTRSKAGELIFGEISFLSCDPESMLARPNLETGSSDADASDNTEIEGVSVEVKVNSGELISF